MGKGEIYCNKQFFLFPTVFSTLLENFQPFSSTQKFCLQTISVRKGQKFVIWERVKGAYHNIQCLLVTGVLVRIYARVLVKENGI